MLYLEKTQFRNLQFSFKGDLHSATFSHATRLRRDYNTNRVV